MFSAASPDKPGASTGGGDGMPSAQTLALVADALPWPLLLLRSDGTLVHANLAGRRMLHRKQPLQLAAQRRVQAAEPRRRDEFDAALEHAASGGRPRLLHWQAGGRPVTASVSALAPTAGSAPALLLAMGPEDGRAADLQAYADLHRLSDAETRVLQRLALGESSARAAKALGVAAATVRSQTVSLRRKTGHASVAELLRELASMPPIGLAPPAVPST